SALCVTRPASQGDTILQKLLRTGLWDSQVQTKGSRRILMTSAKRQIFTVLLACVLLMTTGAAFAAYTGDQSPVLEPDEANTVQVVKQTKASVVAISIRVQGKAVNPLKNMPPAMRQFFQQFMGGQMQKRKRIE